MPLSHGDKQRIIQNNHKISELLRENEDILIEAGYDPPHTNFALKGNDKIAFPSGYIRTVGVLIKAYDLKRICPNTRTRHNITYALETADLINFILNRVHIWGSVETIFIKLAVVNLVSVMEAIVLEAANNICCTPGDCGKQEMCTKHFSKAERNNAKKAIEKLVSIGVLNYEDSKLERIQEIIDLRNRIHIRLTAGNEMMLNDFNKDLYNEVAGLLWSIDTQISSRGVPMYGCE